MRKLVAVSLLAIALLSIQASAGHAAGHGHHGGGHGLPGPPGFPRPPVFRGHPGFPGPHVFPGPPRFHGHFRGHGVVVIGPSFWWDPWWYYPPYYYPPLQVVVQPAPVIVEGQPAQSYWYYCPSAGAYYPTVPTCPEMWIKVAPQ